MIQVRSFPLAGVTALSSGPRWRASDFVDSPTGLVRFAGAIVGARAGSARERRRGGFMSGGIGTAAAGVGVAVMPNGAGTVKSTPHAEHASVDPAAPQSKDSAVLQCLHRK